MGQQWPKPVASARRDCSFFSQLNKGFCLRSGSITLFALCLHHVAILHCQSFHLRHRSPIFSQKWASRCSIHCLFFQEQRLIFQPILEWYLTHKWLNHSVQTMWWIPTARAFIWGIEARFWAWNEPADAQFSVFFQVQKLIFQPIMGWYPTHKWFNHSVWSLWGILIARAIVWSTQPGFESEME